jgi:hypothetical protein
MNCRMVEKIANAVLYEGYMLYPYTASSLKNQRRWNFGVLTPRGDDTSEMQTEVLVEGDGEPAFHVRARFLWYEKGDEPVEQAVDVDGPGFRRALLPLGGAAAVEASVAVVAERLRKITVRIRNATLPAEGDALRRSLLSTHTILTVRGGAFVSLMDPPVECREAAKACRNIGTWPVLVGDDGERDTMLSSPVILYDYPRIAPESAGDLFDATEIDELLTLRLRTLSDREKAEIRAGDGRAREVLERAESLAPGRILKMHAAMRGLPRPDPPVRQGDRVRLRPRKGGDILDLALAGQLATVESVEQDYEGRVHIAVVLDEDPGRELGMMRQPGHRFFFGADEVEPAP